MNIFACSLCSFRYQKHLFVILLEAFYAQCSVKIIVFTKGILENRKTNRGSNTEPYHYESTSPVF